MDHTVQRPSDELVVVKRICLAGVNEKGVALLANEVPPPSLEHF